MKSRLVKFLLATVLVATTAVALTGCQAKEKMLEGAVEAKQGLDAARSLHKLDFTGWHFGTLEDPYVIVNHFANPDSYFIARRTAPATTQDQVCAEVFDFAKAHLSGLTARVGLGDATDLVHAQAFCHNLPLLAEGTGLVIGGKYHKVEVGLELQSLPHKQLLTITANGTDRSYFHFDKPVLDEFTNATAFLNALAERRAANGGGLFRDADLRAITAAFKAPIARKFVVTWKPAADGKVHEVQFVTSRTDLLPACVNVDPWNSAVQGPDIGAPYSMTFWDATTALATADRPTFGWAVQGKCK